MSWRRFLAVGLVLVTCLASAPAQVQNVLLQDFESTTGGFVRVNTTNSPATAGDSFTTVARTSEGGSFRLHLTDGGFTNGVVATFSGAIPSAGHYLVTADIKVDSTPTAPISTYGMAVNAGGQVVTPAKISDMNAGYVMNLRGNSTNGAALGYQTIAASVQASSAGDLTVYFSTDPSRGSYSSLPSSDGDFSNAHRTGENQFGAGANVYIDNIRLIGPGNYGEERHFWISVGDSPTNLSTITSRINTAFANNYNTVVVLARYRANALYVPNRTDSTYTNNEPFYPGVNANNDPLQHAIDRCRALGMRVFVAFGCFAVTDGIGAPFPSVPDLDPAWRTYEYNGGSPTIQVPDSTNPAMWLDAGNPDARAYTIRIASDIVANYDVDGLILDRVRFPDGGNQWGYNPGALAAYGYAGPVPTPGNSTFVAQRQQAVAVFVRDMYNALTGIKPWVIVAATPVLYGDGMTATYNSVMQHFPTWSEQLVANKVHSFGALDLITPQVYRQWNSTPPFQAPGANRTLMLKLQYGDVGTLSRDMGLMPGALMNYAPLFFQATNGDTSQAEVIAQHICDVRGTTYGFAQGWGTFSAVNIQSVLPALRTYATTCGTDVLASAASLPDYLMKEGWDSTPPNNVTTLAATPGFGSISLAWSHPAAAADGESPSSYRIYRSTTTPVAITWANLVNKTTVVTGTSWLDTLATGMVAGTPYYYAVVPVDDYNNRGSSNEEGPVTATSGDLIVESRQIGTLSTTPNTTSPTFSVTGTFSDTSSKSSASGLQASRSLFNTVPGSTATFAPAFANTGRYNVYITIAGGAGNSNNFADANFTIHHAEGSTSGTVALKWNDATISNTWKLIGSDLKFLAGPAGSSNARIVLTNVNGNNATGARFVVDAVRFEYVELPVTVSGFVIE